MDDAIEVLGELREAVRRAMGVARFPIAVPFTARVGRAGLEAAPAARAEAQRIGHRLVAIDVYRAQHGGEHDARPVFRRQQLEIEAQRTQSRFDRGVRQGQHRRQVRLRIVLVLRSVDVRRRHDQGRIAAVLQPVDKLERGFFQVGERELVVVVLVPIVPAPDARDAVVQALGEHDDATAIELRDMRAIEARAVGDADEIGTELACSCLNRGRCQRFPVNLHGLPSACA